MVLLGLISTFAVRGEEPAITEKDRANEPVVMDSIAVDVGYIPKQSFGFTMNVRKDKNTGMVHAIYVTDVERGSDAQRRGLGPRVRIYRINGKAVEDFPASFLAGTELNRIFINRTEGARVTLEISIPGRAEPKVVTLVQHLLYMDDRSSLPRF